MTPLHYFLSIHAADRAGFIHLRDALIALYFKDHAPRFVQFVGRGRRV